MSFNPSYSLTSFFQLSGTVNQSCTCFWRPSTYCHNWLRAILNGAVSLKGKVLVQSPQCNMDVWGEVDMIHCFTACMYEKACMFLNPDFVRICDLNWNCFSVYFAWKQCRKEEFFSFLFCFCLEQLQSEVEKPLLTFRENFKKDMKRFDHHIADLRKQLVSRYAAVEKVTDTSVWQQ